MTSITKPAEPAEEGLTMAIRVTLSSANMGDVDELDFDIWASFVAENIDAAVGFDVAEVDQHRFGDSAEDEVDGGSDEQEAEILEWLSHAGWEAFCGDEWGAQRAVRLCGDLAARVGDDGTGDLRVIVDTALAENPGATLEDLVEIVQEAREDARRERERENA